VTTHVGSPWKDSRFCGNIHDGCWWDNYYWWDKVGVCVVNRGSATCCRCVPCMTCPSSVITWRPFASGIGSTHSTVCATPIYQQLPLPINICVILRATWKSCECALGQRPPVIFIWLVPRHRLAGVMFILPFVCLSVCLGVCEQHTVK